MTAAILFLLFMIGFMVAASISVGLLVYCLLRAIGNSVNRAQRRFIEDLAQRLDRDR